MTRASYNRMVDAAAIAAKFWEDDDQMREVLDMWGESISGHVGLIYLAADAAEALGIVAKKESIRFHLKPNARWLETIEAYAGSIYFYLLKHAKEWPDTKVLQLIASASIVRES